MKKNLERGILEEIDPGNRILIKKRQEKTKKKSQEKNQKE